VTTPSPTPPPQVRPPDEQQIVTMLRWLLIGVMVVVVFTILSKLAHVLTPVLVAFGIAYMLDPAVEKLVKRGMSRTWAATLLLVGFLGAVVGLSIVLIPLIIDQVQTFNAHLGQHLWDVDEALGQFGYQLDRTVVDPNKPEKLRELISGALANKELATSALGILATLAEGLLIPVFAFYFLLDWPNVTNRLRRIIPPRRRGIVLEILGQIDDVVSGWVRGQLIVTSTLAVLYAIAFSIVGVKYAVPLGLLVGGLTIIPFVGTFVGAAIMAAFLLLGSQGSSQLIGVGIIFVVLHMLEAAVLTPKIVGHKVGLSESAALFAVLAGGKLLGFVGILLAVPIAATIAVLLRHVARRYEKSEFFGHEDDAIVPVTGAMAMVMMNESPSGSRSLQAEPRDDTHDKPDDDPVT